jgi:hypothetical protein
MSEGKQVRLTSGEISQLWTQYMNDSASICLLSHFYEKAVDAEIKPLIKHSLELANAHINKISAIFTQENNVIPHGFKLEEDVDLTAPRLFSDIYVLNFIHLMSKTALSSYALSLALAVRSDITKYYKECISESMNLYEKSKDILLSKGLFIRSPYSASYDHVDYVQKQSFMLDFFGDKRPLTATEIANLYSNIQRVTLGVATLIGFSQVASSKDVTNIMIKGIDIAKNHIEGCASKLKEDDVPIPLGWDIEVTKSNQYTFSEKLMMFYGSVFISMGIGFYGFSLTSSPRGDLAVMYNKFILDTQRYAEDATNVMIKNSWLEQPPTAPDRDGLAKKNYKNE